jgi:hypothetical protein
MRPWMSFSDHSCCFMSSVLFHSQCCSSIGVGVGCINFSVRNVEEKAPKGAFPPASGCLLFGVEERTAGCPLLCACHARAGALSILWPGEISAIKQ